MEDYESILLVKPDVHVFKIPPRQSNRGYRAADWNLAVPEWSGRMRLVAKSQKCILKLEDKNSGDLFAQCPVDTYPGVAIEAVNDSSRYFVLKIQDDSGRSAYIGIGFSDRSDSFDLNVALQDHFKWLKKSDAPEESQPRLDLGFKDGQTIKINMNIAKKEGSDSPMRSKPKPGTGFLPPPPPPGVGVTRIGLPSFAKTSPVDTDGSSLLDVAASNLAPSSDWSDFTSASSQPRPPQNATVNSNWVQF